VAEHHQEQQVVARAVPAGLGRLQQGGEFGRGQEVLGPFMAQSPHRPENGQLAERIGNALRD